jgi:serine/threonine protein kinase
VTTEPDGRRRFADRYRVDGSLGRGGMSEVFHVLDGLERDRKRFLREIRTAAQLEHPGAPAVYDTGVEVRGDGTTQVWLVRPAPCPA